jgi:hypothetical protein
MAGGAKPGERRGGRRKGTPNRATATRLARMETAPFNQEIIEKAKADGVTPLNFMLAVMADSTVDFRVRCDMAKAAAPYVHPRLSAMMVREDKPVDLSGARDQQEIYDAILALAASS